MIDSTDAPRAEELIKPIQHMFERSAGKIRAIERAFGPGEPSPVVTAEGRYRPQGWTEWTQGFQHGSAALQFEATGDPEFLHLARERTVGVMATHLTHTGVHDHGFNNVSTYGNLWRLGVEGRFECEAWERRFYELALKVTGAVQASRWTRTADSGGYIYSFNGPQSLFVDTIRSCRALAISHALGHSLDAEQDETVSLLARLVTHAASTARYNIWYGEGRDAYDVRGRTAHESLFNTNNGVYRCPSTQQGYSPFSTWTRGLAWAVLGFAEQLEYLDTRSDQELEGIAPRDEVEAFMRRAAEATCDFYIEWTPPDGVPYWDTGAPGLEALGDWRAAPADPFNDHEPVDSSAAAIAAQGLIRLGRWLLARGESSGQRFVDAGFVTTRTLLGAPYLSEDEAHQGLLLHSIYHRPNQWDHVPHGHRVPCGEACMWGDYHLRELGVYVLRIARGESDYRFFGPLEGSTT